MADDLEGRAEALARKLAAAGVHVTPDNRVGAKTAASVVGVSEGTMRNWRSDGTGPRWLKAGKVWYAVDDLLLWLDAGARDVTDCHR